MCWFYFCSAPLSTSTRNRNPWLQLTAAARGKRVPLFLNPWLYIQNRYHRLLKSQNKHILCAKMLKSWVITAENQYNWIHIDTLEIDEHPMFFREIIRFNHFVVCSKRQSLKNGKFCQCSDPFPFDARRVYHAQVWLALLSWQNIFN